MGSHTNSRRAYTIPQRRGLGDLPDQDAEPRGLGDLDYGNWKLVLLFRAQGGFGSPSTQAPFRVTPVPKEEVDCFDEHLQTLILGSESDSVAYIHLPKQLSLEEGAAEVLLWFCTTSREQGAGDSPITDTGAQLALPSSLSPDERKRWHQTARTAGLYSSSSGLRDNRRLLVHASAVESNEQWAKRDLKAQSQAREAHELLCEVHGGHSSYSVSELEEMIVSGVELPPEILTQKTIKSATAELWKALDTGRANTAIKLLRETEFPRELACRRNAERTSYPMHAAVSGNMPEVALELANPSRYAGVFTQRDSNGKTALGLACASRQVDLVIAFMTVGARDSGGDIDALHRTLIRIGDRATRRVLNSSPYTTAFRRKTVGGSQGAAGKAMQRQELPNREASGRQPQTRRNGAAQQRHDRDQEKEEGLSAEGAADENSEAQADTPKETSRRRLAATGVNSLRALLQHNAAALASSPSPSSRMAEEQQHAKQAEQPARVRRGRGRFQGSEEAATGHAHAVAPRQAARETKATARETSSEEVAITVAHHPCVEAAESHYTAESSAPGDPGCAESPQEARQGQGAHVHAHAHAAGQMPSVPEQSVRDVHVLQAATGVQYVATGTDGALRQASPTNLAPGTEGHVQAAYGTPSPQQYAVVSPPQAQTAVNVHSAQQYAAGNFTYVTNSGASPGTMGAVATAGKAPGQVMYVLVTGSDGGQYLLPVMEAQVA